MNDEDQIKNEYIMERLMKMRKRVRVANGFLNLFIQMEERRKKGKRLSVQAEFTGFRVSILLCVYIFVYILTFSVHALKKTLLLIHRTLIILIIIISDIVYVRMCMCVRRRIINVESRRSI